MFWHIVVVSARRDRTRMLLERRESSLLTNLLTLNGARVVDRIQRF